MATVTVRRLSEETHTALKLRAAKNRRSLAAEVRAIPEESISPKPRLKIGSESAAFGRPLSDEGMGESRMTWSVRQSQSNQQNSVDRSFAGAGILVKRSCPPTLPQKPQQDGPPGVCP
jgi:plasmid stability protein